MKLTVKEWNDVRFALHVASRVKRDEGVENARFKKDAKTFDALRVKVANYLSSLEKPKKAP